MTKNKVPGRLEAKALFLTTSPRVAGLAASCLNKRKGIACELFSGSEEDCLKASREKQYYLFISHGNLAERLRSIHEVPVLEVPPDFYSLSYDAAQLCSAGFKKPVIIAEETDENDIKAGALGIPGLDCKLTVISGDAADNSVAVGDAKLNGADAVLGSYKTAETARKLGLEGREFSVSSYAIDCILTAAQRILHLEKVKRLQLTRLDLLISNISEGVIIFNLVKEPVFHNAKADQILKGIELDDWFDTLAGYFDKSNNQNIVVTLNDRHVLMHTMRFLFPGTDIDNRVIILQDSHEIERSEYALKTHNISRGLFAKYSFGSIVSEDPKTKECVALAQKFAGTDSSVLIYGETGVGKEVFAQAIHNASARKGEAFVSVNCAALPQSLIESELFGYVEGAFTGARSRGKKGLFELADHGTIFLDEIGELPLDVQSSLLRVLQEKSVMRIGDDRVIPVDVRIICATNRDLRRMCREGKYRMDLFYRINVLKLHLPPLRERKGDILPMFRKFLTANFGSSNYKITAEAQKWLLNWYWHGNIRELRNAAEALVIYGPEITAEVLRSICMEVDQPDEAIPAAGDEEDSAAGRAAQNGLLVIDPTKVHSLKEVETVTLQAMLETMNQQELCRKLGISRATLWRKLKEN